MPDIDYARKIALLLNQAEDVAGTPEADAFFAKATQLMMKYAIDEAMVAAARGAANPKPEEITQLVIPHTGIQQDELMRLTYAVTQHNGCRAFYSKRDDVRPKRNDLVVVGFESDLRNVQLLATSLQLQCAAAMSAWWKLEGSARYSWSKGEAYRAKREFIIGFTSSVSTKMAAARRAAESEVATDYGRANGTTEGVGAASVALVLRSRKESVNDWYDKTYGSSNHRGRVRNIQRGGAGANSAGHAAGRAANIGGTSVGSTHIKSIGG